MLCLCVQSLETVIEMYEENLTSHLYIVRIIIELIAFSYNSGSSLTLPQNWARDGFFKFIYALEPETVIELSFPVTLKSITSVLYFEWISCSCACFGNIILWSFGSSVPNTGTLDYSDLHNVSTFHYRRSKKITFVNVTTDFIRKVFRWEAVKVIETDTSFPAFKFPLESVDINVGHKCCQLFSVK